MKAMTTNHGKFKQSRVILKDANEWHNYCQMLKDNRPAVYGWTSYHLKDGAKMVIVTHQ